MIIYYYVTNKSKLSDLKKKQPICDGWWLDLCGDHFTVYTNVKSLCYTAEITMMSVNYT